MTVASASRASRADGDCVIDIPVPFRREPRICGPARHPNRNGTALFR
jgi:hypothetical protein